MRIKVCTTRKVRHFLPKRPSNLKKTNFILSSSTQWREGSKKVNTKVNKRDRGFFGREKVGFLKLMGPRGSFFRFPFATLQKIYAGSQLGAWQINQERLLTSFGIQYLSKISDISLLKCYTIRSSSITKDSGETYTAKVKVTHKKFVETAQLKAVTALILYVSESYAQRKGPSQQKAQFGKAQPEKAQLGKAPKKALIQRRAVKLRIYFLLQQSDTLEEYKNHLHCTLVIRIELVSSSDVERNPGPRKQDESTVLVTSYNVRGLNEDVKLRHLINYCYSKSQKDKDQFFFFQETFVTKPNKIPYLWRGNLHFTPGSGNGSGCITLLSSHINLIETVDFGMRGHIIVCQKSGDSKASYIAANIYAPCPNNQEKVTFFEEIFDKLSELIITYECENVIVAGDFNLNFGANEVKNRNYSAQEKRVAQIVASFSEGIGLCDVWRETKKTCHTWRRANSDTFSTIDRILFSKAFLEINAVSTNWSLSMSDHAAIELTLSQKGVATQGRSKITRLDPSLLKIPECKEKIVEEFETMFAHAGNGWNPHLKLEYAKMCIRTVVEHTQAERKRKEKTEEEGVNEELNIAVTSLENSPSDKDEAELIDYIEELRERKAQLVEEKGKRLADKLGTKWYNEGEKSTRYFLNLLKRPAPDRFKTIVDNNGVEISSQEAISAEIVSFYKNLYEEYDRTNLVDISINDNFFDLIDPVPAEDAAAVTTPITIQDLERTLLTCKDSAPGPDGIPYSIYRVLWRTIGPILVEAWNYTINTGKLCPSHKVSFLKLIPKVGKDNKKLTNWRPITLSNCDHKLITKTYSNRMCSAIAQRLKERQTAYIKGRLINDNIRAILATIDLTNNEDLDGLLVSLDAKKAFDSVEHSFIEKCLTKFGLGNFVPIFKILYSELKSDIIINGRITDGFCIRRGVKQGDALSCILFIMCMEPLLRNIEENQLINELSSNKYGNLPKVYAYADDVSSIIVNSERGLQALFDEYERLTKASGLELNADKTEIMRLRRHNPNNDVAQLNFNVHYCGRTYQIETLPEIKINGIIFQQNVAQVVQVNVEIALKKIDRILRGWAARHLSVLGKILIVKTFAISQVIICCSHWC